MASLRAQRLAWAGVRLELPNAVIFVDPLLDPAVWDQALADPLLPLDGGPAMRFVLVTHLHPDHFDPKAVRQALGSGGTLVCDASVAADAASRGFQVRGARPFEPLLLGDFTATAVPAVDGYGAPQVSWVVDGGGRRVIHCGDTLWHGLWWQVRRQLGPFDAAFLPINGARFGWRQPAAEVPSVMTAEQAVAAAVVLGARIVVPIHYGVRGADGYEEEPQALARLAEIASRRRVAVQQLRPGDWVRWADPFDQEG
jgi:L-ascorbate metabolism protein UlaG (beta-lactamase superfamily)